MSENAGENKETGSPLDRALQREMLTEMQAVYPELVRTIKGQKKPKPEWIGNLVYLQEHGLCVAQMGVGIDGHWNWGGAKITAKGLDFLADDGGLSAILGVVTIKLHADTLRDIIAAKIDSTGASDAEKSVLKSQLKKLPATALQLASTDLMKTGLDHLPNAIQWLHTLVGGL